MTVVQQAWQDAVFVAGDFRRPESGGTLGVRDKASGAVFATVGLAGQADVDGAVAAAKAAQPAWSEAAYTERAALLRAVAAELGNRAGSFRELIMRETGCIAGKADYEIGAAASELTEAAGLASRATGEVLPSGHAGRFSLSERIPVGLVGVITPWNFPLVLGMRVIAPAIALGNAVLLKPSPETPVSGGLAIAELFAAAGAPPGLFQVLPGDVEVGQRLVTHPDVAMIHFTGSTTVGRQIAQAAGGLLKKVSLELGGNNALIVLDDADLDQATMIGAWSSFHYQGQTCITAGRHIVHASLADSYISGLAARADAITLGNTVEQQVGLGPMINSRQLARATAMLDEAVADGARIVAGGSTDGPVLPADGRRRRQPRVPAVERGDLRADRSGPGRPGRRGGDRGGQRHRIRAGRTRCSPGIPPAASGWPAGCGPAWCTSTTPPRRTRRWPRSAGSASPAWAAAPAATPTSRSSPSGGG